MTMLAVATPRATDSAIHLALRDANSSYRNRPIGFAASSTDPYSGRQRSSATHRQRRNPHSA
jgi:hypothetical protein